MVDLPVGKDGYGRDPFTIESGQHDGLSIHHRDGLYTISAWAETRDDTWSWEGAVTVEEAAVAAGDPDAARALMSSERHWSCRPPSSFDRPPTKRSATSIRATGSQTVGAAKVDGERDAAVSATPMCATGLIAVLALIPSGTPATVR